MKLLIRSRVAGSTVGRHITYQEYLRRGRTNIDLAPTLIWDEFLLFLAISTASVPVLMHVLSDLGSVHLLTNKHSRSDGESSHPLSTLESGTGSKKDSATKECPDPNVFELDNIKRAADDTQSESVATSQGGRRPSEGSEVTILRHC